MRIGQLALILLSILLLGIGLALFFYYGFYLREYRETRYDFDVRTGGIGINVDTDAIHFGGLNPGGSGYRYMNITPAHDGRLVIGFQGKGASFLLAQPNNITLRQGSPVRIQFVIDVPDDAPLGNYSGAATFSFFRW